LHLHMQCSSKLDSGRSYDADADGQGNFTFVGVPEDVCAVNIDGRRLSNDHSYHLNSSEEEAPWIIRLIPGVSISGTVLDEKGSPIERARVFLGRSAWDVAGPLPPFSQNVFTDGQGHFRFEVPQEPAMFRHDEDKYRICAEYSHPGAEQRPAYPMICFPGVSDWRAAEWVELHPGQSRDFTLRLTPVPGGTVSVTGPLPTGDLRVSNVWICLCRDPEFSTSAPWLEAVYFDRATSTFRLAGLAPGKYRISGSIESPGERLTAADEAEVRSGEVTNVALLLTPDPILRGRVRTDDGSPVPPAKPGESRHMSIGSDHYIQVPISDDGLFQVSLDKLALYRWHFELPRPWHVASARQGDHDALFEDIHVGAEGGPLEPLDVVISQSAGTLGISVTHKEGVFDRIVLLHRIGARLEDDSYLLDAGTHVDGPAGSYWYRISPGDYLVFAMPRKQTPPYSVPYLEKDFLDRHKELIREVKLREGDTTRVELTVLDLPH